MISEQIEVPADSGATVEHLWRTVQKRRWLIIIVAAVVMAGAVFFTLGQTKIYRAVTTLQIDPSPPSPLGRDVQAIVAMGADAFWNNQEYYATQHRILKSRRIAADAVRALALNRDSTFMRNVPPDPSAPPATASVEDAVTVLLGRLNVEGVKDSRLVTATFEDANPERARRVLGAVVNAYLQRNVDDAVASNSSAGDWLRDQLVKLKDDLENSERALHDYKKDKRILSVSLDDQSNMLVGEMRRLSEALTDARARREHAASRSRELAKINPQDPVEIPVTELLQSELLTQLRATYVASRGELAGIVGSGKGENHPDVLASRAKLETAREALITEIKNVQGAVNADLSGIAREAGGIEKLVEGAKQRAFDLNLLEIEYRRLERTKSNNEKLYSILIERSKESDLASMLRFNNIRVVEDPLAGNWPVKPRVPLNLGIGAVAGLLLGLVAAFGREQLDRSIKTSDEVERELGQTFLGTLPYMDNMDPKPARRRRSEQAPVVIPELLVHDQPNSGLAEAARGIRTNLMFMSPDSPYRQILITSASPAEGKTTVASAIAIAMAQANQRVLLMDCDLRRPRLHRVYGRTNDIGVTSITLEPELLDRHSLQTPVPNLDLLPAGPHVPNPSEFLHSDAFNALLTRLASRYDRVVIDSPPASIVSDSSILGTKVDGTVFVVRASKTLRETARKAIRSLRDVGAPIAGIVLNALDLKRLGYGKSYYYYQYSSYSSDEKRDAA